MSLNVDTIVVGPFQVNCYLCWDSESGDAVIIDPGEEEERIVDIIERANVTLRAILLTHGHGDHIAAVESIKSRFNLPLYVGDGEQELLANPSANVSALIGHPIVSPPADRTLRDEERLSLGSLVFTVLATPGHSPGGVCYLHESAGLVFCGDTLFAGSVGRTDFPGCSHEQLIESIEKKLLPLPDSVVCYPGHGPATTIGAERNHNPFLLGGQFA